MGRQPKGRRTRQERQAACEFVCNNASERFQTFEASQLATRNISDCDQSNEYFSPIIFSYIPPKPLSHTVDRLATIPYEISLQSPSY